MMHSDCRSIQLPAVWIGGLVAKDGCPIYVEELYFK